MELARDFSDIANYKSEEITIVEIISWKNETHLIDWAWEKRRYLDRMEKAVPHEYCVLGHLRKFIKGASNTLTEIFVEARKESNADWKKIEDLVCDYLENENQITA